MRSGLKRAAVGLAFAVTSTGCFGCGASKVAKPEPPRQPDMTGIMKLIGRWVVASGCPVGPRTVVTNAHVVDIQPFNLGFPMTPVQFQHGTRLGILMPLNGNNYRDIAYMGLRTGEPDLAMWYPVATNPPGEGDTIYFSGYDWSSRRNAFADRIFTAKVLRIVAGHVIYEPSGAPGTSGSCVLNEAGEVVAINAFGKAVGVMGSQEVGGAVLFVKGLE